MARSLLRDLRSCRVRRNRGRSKTMYRLSGATVEQVGPDKRNSGTDSRLSCAVIPLGTAARVRQRRKIEEIGEALARAGYTSLDAQARVLGLSRSTTWTVLTGVHKS